LTCAHTGTDPSDRLAAKQYSVRGIDGVEQRANLIALSEYHDVALLLVEEPNQHFVPVSISQSPPEPNQAYRLVGILREPNARLSIRSNRLITFLRQRRRAEIVIKNDVVQLDVDLYEGQGHPGDSGSLIITQSGQIQGIYTGGRNNACFSVPADTLRDIIGTVIAYTRAE
ncbi:MAG TPA: serine protease, partial [Candidatus Nanoarchaeia archaeon]|nr:serine protease [Candidatus Nanoarchaeia archaeon]